MRKSRASCRKGDSPGNKIGPAGISYTNTLRGRSSRDLELPAEMEAVWSESEERNGNPLHGLPDAALRLELWVLEARGRRGAACACSEPALRGLAHAL